jgi:hypothetical protein
LGGQGIAIKVVVSVMVAVDEPPAIRLLKA